MSIAFNAMNAFDEALSGKTTHLVRPDGHAMPLEVDQWSAPPDWVDHQLFIDPCDGATIDVGCGPGRLVGELARREIHAIGIDVSKEAIRQTRVRGAMALRRDVFSGIPGEGQWDYALLADGNLGIGGDPVRLLDRLREVLTLEGKVIAEIADHGEGLIRERRQLRVEGRLSGHFAWAVVGIDAIGDIAAKAGLVVAEIRTIGGRHAATLVRETA